MKNKGLVLSMLLAVSMPLMISASSGTVNIPVTFSDTRIFVNGAMLAYKDEKGDYIKPFLYNNMVYYPVSAIAKALNQPVKWEDKTKSVRIGEKLKLIRDDFKRLKRGMTVDEVEAAVGRESKQLGSGRMINGYDLENDVAALLFYTRKSIKEKYGLDKIVFVDKDGVQEEFIPSEKS